MFAIHNGSYEKSFVLLTSL